MLVRFNHVAGSIVWLGLLTNVYSQFVEQRWRERAWQTLSAVS